MCSGFVVCSAVFWRCIRTVVLLWWCIYVVEMLQVLVCSMFWCVLALLTFHNTYKFAEKASVRSKHSSLLDHFISYAKNEVLWMRTLVVYWCCGVFWRCKVVVSLCCCAVWLMAALLDLFVTIWLMRWPTWVTMSDEKGWIDLYQQKWPVL